MKLIKYNIILNRLTEEKIEMVRMWRNDPKIAQYMEYKEYITSDMQKQWFRKINNDHNYYFIIEFNGEEIGMVNIKDINYEEKQGEEGIFIYNDAYLNSDIPFRTSLCCIDFGFDNLKLNKIKAHILKSNKRAISFNKMIGYKLSIDQENFNNQLYTLSQSDYDIRKAHIIRLL
jgi:RimJ/RimL family protein N-acetyltransferase